MAGKQRASLSKLEDMDGGTDLAMCGICMAMLDEPNSGCPDGHSFCKICIHKWLLTKKTCPTCRAEMDTTKLQRNRPLEKAIGQLRMRCTHGPDEGAGGGEGGAAPLAKRAKLEPVQDMTTLTLVAELGRADIDTKGIEKNRKALKDRLDKHRLTVGGGAGAHQLIAACDWTGKVCDLEAHIAGSCGYEPSATYKCPNAAAGCTESVLRKDVAKHASDMCAKRACACKHCSAVIMAGDLPVHEGSCPEAQIKCPNTGCGVKVARRGMTEHRGVCGWEQVTCPCPGCDEQMARAEVEKHVKTSGAVHVRKASSWAADQEKVVAVLLKRAGAMTHVFTWSAASSGNEVTYTLPHTFMGGVRGRCYIQKEASSERGKQTHFMGFELLEGPADGTMHFECTVLSKNDDKVVSVLRKCDFQEPPFKLPPMGRGYGVCFSLNDPTKAAAVRADGSVTLRMDVHLYLGMEEKVAEQGRIIAAFESESTLTHVFTLNTDSAWKDGVSEGYTFAAGVRGHCWLRSYSAHIGLHAFGFCLTEGPGCKFYLKCTILDKDDKAFRVVSPAETYDFQKPPSGDAVGTDQVSLGKAGSLSPLTEAEKARVVRADGSIKLRIVVHLCFPEVVDLISP